MRRYRFIVARDNERLYDHLVRSLAHLEEIPPELTVRADGAGRMPETPEVPTVREAGSLRYEAVEEGERIVDFYWPGVRVRHPEWGIGTIRDRTGDGEDTKVTVTFAGVGIKRLKVKYTNLTRA